MDILQLRDLLCQKQLSFLTISNISFLENCAVLSPEIELNSFLRTVIKLSSCPIGIQSISPLLHWGHLLNIDGCLKKDAHQKQELHKRKNLELNLV